MFKDGVTPEFIPERIFDLIRLVATKPISNKDAAELLEPLSLNNIREYYNMVVKAAIEMRLISKENDILTYVGSEQTLKSLSDFRKYCNSIIWKDENSLFYKITASFIKSDYKLFEYDSILSPSANTYIMNEVNDRNADVKRLRGHRFWLSFLGLGYIQEGTSIYFLPNMYVALKDFISLCNFDANKEYTISEFLGRISDISRIWMSSENSKLKLSAAMSSALRTMHDRREIELKRILDSKEVWSMTKSDVHTFTEITHIKLKGGK